MKTPARNPGGGFRLRVLGDRLSGQRTTAGERGQSEHPSAEQHEGARFWSTGGSTSHGAGDGPLVAIGGTAIKEAGSGILASASHEVQRVREAAGGGESAGQDELSGGSGAYDEGCYRGEQIVGGVAADPALYGVCAAIGCAAVIELIVGKELPIAERGAAVDCGGRERKALRTCGAEQLHREGIDIGICGRTVDKIHDQRPGATRGAGGSQGAVGIPISLLKVDGTGHPICGSDLSRAEDKDRGKSEKTETNKVHLKLLGR